ncbi:uncharacterized protein N7446_005394 [Penicillium canescens]|uniref:Subtelomeric hrmA-associated cluster protein AFUB-079030/YDR124W-like helical bundle domain-containing protein n=1 Tax=Penicillium canescens TaxID=5083 RepID=A0AAD6I9R7_PENCN|nr:uncharacterized protein N7446_005394 [Penicillium canescens]KAJ6038591.1 hypothetical protein N7460_008362 [Penicillium canescens]KAJ6068357.1 hypothetical protein N7446_005394 [Penicillium canescens]
MDSDSIQPVFDVNDKSIDPCFMAQATIPADTRLDKLTYTYFVLIYIDADGTVRLQVSQSIANNWPAVQSARLIDEFLRVVMKHGMLVSPKRAMTMIANTFHSLQVAQVPYTGTNLGIKGQIKGHMRNPVAAEAPFQRTVWPFYNQSKFRLPTELLSLNLKDDCNNSSNMNNDKRAMISVNNRDHLTLYYTEAFESLQQRNCRILAKAYIKLVEPRKQVNYPYNGRKIVSGATRQFDPQVTKPPWWPSGVSYREPDHLPKVERIRLLVHILRELRISHGISVAKLQEADQPIRSQIFPPERLQILDELYQVRQQEEQILMRTNDEQTIAWNSSANLPKSAGTDASTTDGSGDISPINPATVREPEPFIGCPRYVSTVDAPDGEFSTDSSLSHNARPSQIADIKPEQQIIEHQSNFDSLCVSTRVLKRKCDFFETYPVNARPTRLAHDSPPTPSASQPVYGTPYYLQYPEAFLTGSSFTDLSPDSTVKAIAKSHVKLVEPRKQVLYPYNGRRVISGVSQPLDPELTKPGWWPVGALHREPDHLLKPDRLRLLVHILCELKDTHGIIVDKLRSASQDVRRQVAPANRLEILDEIYFVRQVEEQFLDGEIHANTLI